MTRVPVRPPERGMIGADAPRPPFVRAHAA
jgi:hypothetical protein